MWTPMRTQIGLLIVSVVLGLVMIGALLAVQASAQWSPATTKQGVVDAVGVPQIEARRHITPTLRLDVFALSADGRG